MNTVYARCAGLDVHKKSVVACRMLVDNAGQVNQETRTFGTMTSDLLQLSNWLRIGQVTHVAMESTGVYWKPIFNILEDGFEVLLVNAKHIKFVPGRKTDVKMRNGSLNCCSMACSRPVLFLLNRSATSEI